MSKNITKFDEKLAIPIGIVILSNFSSFENVDETIPWGAIGRVILIQAGQTAPVAPEKVIYRNFRKNNIF